MKRLWPAAMLLSLALGCQAGVVSVRGGMPGSAATQGGPLTSMQLTVSLPPRAGFQTQKIDVETTKSLKVSVWGPGAMTPVSPAAMNVTLAGNPPTTTVTVSNVPSGINRIVKVEVYDQNAGAGKLLETLYGVGALNVPGPNTVTVNWSTTPTAYVMALLAKLNGTRTLTTDRAAFQSLIDTLLTNASAHGAQIHPEKLYRAIETKTETLYPAAVLGWSLPAANDTLLADVVSPGASGDVLVFDIKGNLVTTGVTAQIEDPVTTIMSTWPFSFTGAVPNFTPGGDNSLFSANGLSWVVPSSWTMSVKKTDNSRAHSQGVKLDPNGNHTGALALTANLGGTLEAFFGNGTAGSTLTQISDPRQMVMNDAGDLYVADRGNHRVLKIDSTGTATVVAGTGTAGGPAADGTVATAAALRQPEGVALAPDGTLYVADTGNHLVWRLAGDGKLYRFAGTGTAGGGTDSGVATAVPLNGPTSLAFGNSRLYIHDSGNAKLRRIASGLLSTLVIPALNGTLNNANTALYYNTVDVNGTPTDFLYYAKGIPPVLVRRDVLGTDQELVVAGAGGSGRPYPLDDGVVAAIIPSLERVTAVTADGQGNIYFGDLFPSTTNGRLRYTNINHIPPRLFTVGGFPTVANWGGDGVLSTGAQGSMGPVYGLAIKPTFGASEPVYFTAGGTTGTGNHRIRKLSP